MANETLSATKSDFTAVRFPLIGLSKDGTHGNQRFQRKPQKRKKKRVGFVSRQS